jgi:hypothetical protein
MVTAKFRIQNHPPRFIVNRPAFHGDSGASVRLRVWTGRIRVYASLQRLDYESEFDEGGPRMIGPSRLGGAVSERLRRLDDTLGIDHNGGSEWIWGVPAFIFVATVVGFIVIGQIIGMGAAMAAPIGTVIAVVMAGLAIAYMTPVADDAASGPPPEHHDDTPLGSPGGPWVVVEHLRSGPRLDANPTPAPADRELAAIAGPQHGEGVRAVGQAAPAPSRVGDSR